MMKLRLFVGSLLILAVRACDKDNIKQCLTSSVTSIEEAIADDTKENLVDYRRTCAAVEAFVKCLGPDFGDCITHEQKHVTQMQGKMYSSAPYMCESAHALNNVTIPAFVGVTAELAAPTTIQSGATIVSWRMHVFVGSVMVLLAAVA